MNLPKGIWIKHWAGFWSLLSCYYIGTLYVSELRPYLHTTLKHAVFIIRDGRSVCYLNKPDVDRFGIDLLKRKKIPKWCADLKKNADLVFKIVKTKDPVADFEKFMKIFYKYGGPHVGVKKVIDYLSESEHAKYHFMLEDARKYSEPVYAKTEEYMHKLALQLKVHTKELLSTTDVEFDHFLLGKSLPAKKILLQRYRKSALLFIDRKPSLIIGDKVDQLEKDLLGSSKKVEGHCAFPGKARGIARVFLDPRSVKVFNKGDILVTGMTRPEYLPLFAKAAAVVTDAGGMLCHAAITAREMKIPCVIGTRNGTAVIKDGEVIEVDARKGRVIKVHC